MNITGLSRNKVATMLDVPTSRIRAWMMGRVPTAEGVGRILTFSDAYDDACDELELHHLSWDQVIFRGDAAMLLGIGTYALDWKMEAAKLPYIDLGMLGLWLRRAELAQWQR